MASVFMTVQGRSCDTTTAIADSKAKLGVESTKPWLDGHTPEFVDFPFTNPNATFQDHLNVVKQTEPELTVAPDIEKGRTLTSVVNKADKLLQHANTVVIVPKSVHPSKVPNRFRVGVPLANFGTGAPWGVWDYQNVGPVHLLGGGPARQLRTGAHLQVASVDTATLGKNARFGMWDEKSQDAPSGMDYRTRLQKSLDNYAEYWADK